MIIKTILSAFTKLKKCYWKNVREDIVDSVCFEILGFDVLIDKDLKPWLIEVNHAPSFATETQFDIDLKQGLIRDTLKLVNLNPKRKARYKQEQKDKRHEKDPLA